MHGEPLRKEGLDPGEHSTDLHFEALPTPGRAFLFPRQKWRNELNSTDPVTSADIPGVGTDIPVCPRDAETGLSDPSFPLGVRVLLVEEAARRRRVEHAAVEVLERAGFDEVILPVVDYADPYEGVVSRARFRTAYRFTDAGGELLAVRADFTPMLARAVAPLVRSHRRPLRLFYRGDVVRREEARLGRNRECFQIGAELIGEAGADSDAAMIRLAIATARACGADPAVAVSASGLLSMLAGSAETVRRVDAAVRARRRRDLDSIPLDADARPLLESLIDGTLTAPALVNFAPAREIAERLIVLEKDLGGAIELALDDDPGDESYYSGIRFRIVDRRRLVEIGAGGRYDALYGAFGAPAPAIGFTLTIDAIEEAAR